MKAKVVKEVKFKEGFSESAWKSLIVKSLRIGWVPALYAAEEAMGKSQMKGQLICGLFEDTFPAETEIKKAVDLVNSGDYASLCKMQTHHAVPGITQRFFDLREEACAVANIPEERGKLYESARKYGLWLTPRSLNVFWTWLELMPDVSNGERTVDETPFDGFPSSVLDCHTWEGKQVKRGTTILSGMYECHLALSGLVQKFGWKHVRDIVHGEPIEKRKIENEKQDSLF